MGFALCVLNMFIVTSPTFAHSRPFGVNVQTDLKERSDVLAVQKYQSDDLCKLTKTFM